jgi:hypothetical protein
MWLPTFPTYVQMVIAVSAMLLPHKIIYRHKLDFLKHYKAQFRTYCKAHNKPVPTNTMVT